MNSRERLKRALNHQEPDRIPIDLGGTDVSSICRGAYEAVLDHLGWPAKNITLVNVVEQLPALDEAFLDTVVRADTRQIREGGPARWQLELFDDGDYVAFINEWGITFHMPKENGHYFDLVDYPLKSPSLEALAEFPWPDPKDPARWQGLREHARDLYENTDYALVVGCIFGGGIFEFPQYLRGMEAFLSDLLLAPRFADALTERITQVLIAAYEAMLDQVGPYVQVVTLCDDLSTQRGPFISPDLYRRFFKERQRQLIEAIRRKTDAKIMMHICGAARCFIPDLIEIGVDILNPVQVSAAGMDAQALKRDFGTDLSFWGGVCNPQHTLPFGSAEDVRGEARRSIDVLAPGGGFVFAPVHNIQDGVPPANVLALFETAYQYGVY
jgi:uroporphyrinogen decarboxylase